ncbi:MAG: tyrosine-type recombinase/integrase [Microthrixaceae bacterium]|nr:tyrosine-type recombinase/integrase [Microthrixaceae bacterium]
MAGRPRLEIGTYGDIAARETKSGKWLAETRFRDVDGVTRPVTATADTEAKSKARLKSKLKDRQKRGGKQDSLTEDSTVNMLLDRWLDNLEKRRRPEDAEERVKGLLDGETIDKYTEAADKFVRAGIGEVTLRELDTQRMDGYLSTVTARGKHIRTVCSQACAMAVRWGLMKYNPVREAEKPVPKASDKRVLTEEDARILMARAVDWQERKPGQLGPQRGVDMVQIVAMLLATGERSGEVLAIRWEDIAYLDDKTRPAEVTISGSVTKKGVRKPMPKTASGFRTVKLPEWARDELLRQRERGLPFDLVFPTRNGTPRQGSNVNKHWREIRGEDYKWVTPRTFRKTTSTAIERDHGAEAASKQLGHSTPDVTRKHYIARATDAGDYTETLEKLNPFSPNKDRMKPHLRVVGED